MNDQLLPVSSPAPVTPVRGEGSWLCEADGSDNIVRLLSALTRSEADAAEALARFGASCARGDALLKGPQGAVV